jgi:CheY-like chemotaxis protein
MEEASGSPGTILLVEDDEQVRGFIRSVLRDKGYRVLEAADGRAGLEVAQSRGREIDLLLADMLLPELSGFDLAETLRRQFPELKVLFITGYVEGEIVQRSITELGAFFLDKPFQPSVLVSKVKQALETRTASEPRA